MGVKKMYSNTENHFGFIELNIFTTWEFVKFIYGLDFGYVQFDKNLLMLIAG